MKGKVAILALLLGLAISATSLFAHHGQANYNTKDPVTVSGTVTDFQFINPHCLVFFDAKDEKGEIQKWQGELTSPNHLVRAGWRKDSLKAGDQVTVTGWRAASGANSLWITKFTVNGEDMKLGQGN